MTKSISKRLKSIRQTKRDQITKLLQRSAGASIAELVKATGWQKHSMHGFMSGTLKKKHSLSIINSKSEDKDRRHFIREGAR